MMSATRTPDMGAGHPRDLLGQTVDVLGGGSGIGPETVRRQLLSNRAGSR